MESRLDLSKNTVSRLLEGLRIRKAPLVAAAGTLVTARARFCNIRHRRRRWWWRRWRGQHPVRRWRRRWRRKIRVPQLGIPAHHFQIRRAIRRLNRELGAIFGRKRNRLAITEIKEQFFILRQPTIPPVHAEYRQSRDWFCPPNRQACVGGKIQFGFADADFDIRTRHQP